MHTGIKTLIITLVGVGALFGIVFLVQAAPTIGDTNVKATLGNDLIGGSKYIYSVQGLSIATTTTSTAAIYLGPGGKIIFSDSSEQTTAFGGGTQDITAGQVSMGIFGSLSTKGNYTFQAAGNSNIVLYIDAGNERVGIGTANPSDPLHIQSTTVPWRRGQLFLTDDRAYSVAGTGGQLTFGGKYNSSGTYTEWASIAGVKENTTDGTYGANLELRTRTHGADVTTKVWVMASGNVGIGTASPTLAKLVVDGDIALEYGGYLKVNAAWSPGNNYILQTGWRTGGDFVDFYVPGDGAINEPVRMTIRDTGNVGIGTNNPGYKLDVLGGTTTARFQQNGSLAWTSGIVIDGPGSDTYIFNEDATNGYTRFRNTTTGKYVFANSGGTNVITLDAGTGVITATGGNSGSWNTAYGWGNHASAGYSTGAHATGDITGVTAGAGLADGGTSGTVTLNVGAGNGMIVNADNVALPTSVYTSANRPGPTRLYRRDNDSDYNIQITWTGTRWDLYGYNGDTGHADTQVGYADSAGNANACNADGSCGMTDATLSGILSDGSDNFRFNGGYAGFRFSSGSSGSYGLLVYGNGSTGTYANLQARDGYVYLTDSNTYGNYFIRGNGADAWVRGSLTVGGGTGKLNAGTIDPIYTINNTRYATYMAGMVGIKEETTGVAMLRLSDTNNTNLPVGRQVHTNDANVYEYVIDFDELEIGSDIWLFAQTINVDGRAHISEDGTIYRTTSEELFDNMTILLTPGFNGDVWYEKDPENRRLVMYGTEGGEVSYRLTAPRFDWKTWKNTTDDEIEGFNLDKLLQ